MLAPVEKVNGIYLKRNDLNVFCGCFGGKAECAFNMMSKAPVKKFVTCGSRDSLQCEMVSQMCDMLGYECHIFIPSGKDTKTTLRISKCETTTLHRVENGYTVVVNKRAEDFARENNMTLIPFGMQSMTAVDIIANQVRNIPDDVTRVVVPVGGGITMCGVMNGLVRYNRTDVHVLGVITGKNPDKVIKMYEPWFNPIKYKLAPYKDVSPAKRYAMRVDCAVGHVLLDPVYEGKCYTFLNEGDLLWIVGYHEV